MPVDFNLFAKIVPEIAKIFGFLAIGWLARRLDYLREEDQNRWSRFGIDFLFPMLIFYEVVRGFDPGRLSELWVLPVLGFGIMALGGVLGIGLRHGLKTRDNEVRKTFHHFCAVNNWGFLPLAIIMGLSDVLGPNATALLFLMNLGSRIGYWTIGVGLLGKADLHTAARNILSAPLVALLVALAFSFADLTVPRVPLEICGEAGTAALPIMLIIIGASMYGAPLRQNKRDLAYLSFVRLLLLPAITIGLLNLLPLPDDVYNVVLIVSLMPTAILSTILTRRFGGSPPFAATAGVVTTLASLVTVPIGCLFLR